MQLMTWYKYPAYSEKRPNCFNGFMKISKFITIHIMIHYGELVQIHTFKTLLHDMENDKRLMRIRDNKLISLVEKLSFHLLALDLLNSGEIKSRILSISNGRVSKDYGKK